MPEPSSPSPVTVKPTTAVNWPVAIMCVATLAVLAVAAWRGAVAWHVPVWFALGVVLPATRLSVKLPVGILPPSSGGEL